MVRILSLKRIVPVVVFFITALLLLQLRSAPIPRNDDVRPGLRQRLARAFPYDRQGNLPKYIWQTWKYTISKQECVAEYWNVCNTWSALNPDHHHEILTDDEAAQLIDSLYVDVPEVWQAYEALPRAILKADFFRYLILLAIGGVYTDIDTNSLKPIDEWVPHDMEPIGLIVGIEADPDRPDWHDWYARRIQFCQWTIAAKAGHPILVDVVAAITLETLERETTGQLTDETMKTVMEFTGPGVWTDAVFDYLAHPEPSLTARSEPHIVTWEDFSHLQDIKKVADVAVLPITCFSPGIGHMGAGNIMDPLAFVFHEFMGTWKDAEAEE